MSKFLNLLAAFVLIAPALSMAQEAAAAPAGFDITNISVNGSGCPAGSTVTQVIPNKSAFTIAASNFYAEAGGSVSDKSCVVTIGIDLPPGWRVLTSIDYRGYYQLDSAVTYAQKSEYQFQGQPKQTSPVYNISGPNSGETYAEHVTFSDSNAPCGGPTVLEIKTDISVNSANTASLGYGVVDALDVVFQFTSC